MSSPARVRLDTRDKLVLSALILIMFMASLDSTILATALPTIAGDLKDLQHLSWVVTAYLLTVTSSALIWGKMGDLFGRKHVLQTAIAVFLLGSVLCTQAQTMTELISFRALQGLGGGGMLVVPQAVLAELVGPRDRGRYQIYVAGAGASAFILGPLLGGLLVEQGSWRWAFYLNVPPGLLVLALLTYCLRHQRARKQPSGDIDYWGSLLIATCAAALTLLVTWGGVIFAWFSPQMLLLFGAATALAVLIWWVEHRHPNPLLPFRMVREHVFRIAVPLTFCFWIVESGTVNYLPLYFQAVRGSSPTVSGMLLLPLTLSAILAYTLSGRAISRWGRYRPFPIAGASLIATGLLLCVILRRDASPAAYGAALVVMGLGFGLVSQIVLIAAQSACAYQDVGVTTSAVLFFRNMGSAVGVALCGSVLNRKLIKHLNREIDAGEFTAVETERIRNGESLATNSLAHTARQAYVNAYELAIEDVFLTGLAVSLVVLALAYALPVVPLRHTMTATGARKDTPVIPSPPVGDAHVRQALEDLARGGLQPLRNAAEAHAQQYGISLDEIWLLCAVTHRGKTDTRHLTQVLDASPEALNARLRSLQAKKLLNSDTHQTQPAPLGNDLVEALSRTLRAQLEPPAPTGPAPLDLRPYTLEILAEGSPFRPPRPPE
ncbi:MDR family MFS transporter [Streptomyces sp. H27-H1]|uniref:MDR family MFS transporter n=1 Tax=Streptomyces sp. H27-H1 TaxID=2996461 RepID=UPI0022701941|nr:MDR family MFS transporter [Streptomyces sp. H27-H1]MCY0932409.1 MDR family MFS transporter [Streptomyces sp. H27-H1]